jgi:hypothetical protein
MLRHHTISQDAKRRAPPTLQPSTRCQSWGPGTVPGTPEEPPLGRHFLPMVQITESLSCGVSKIETLPLSSQTRPCSMNSLQTHFGFVSYHDRDRAQGKRPSTISS